MSLSHALLTSLKEQPSSGMELAKRFDRSIGYFWNATHQQIYRELASMEQAGWVQSSAPGKGRGGKKTYKILPKGEEELLRWVRQDEEEPDPAQIRNKLLIRIRADALIGPTGIKGQVLKQKQSHVENLAIYTQIEERDFLNAEKTRKNKVQHAVLKAGMLFEKTCINMCDEVLEALKDDEV